MKLVIQNSSHVWGGNEKWLANLGEGLIARGHTVTVSSPAGPVRDECIRRGLEVSSFRPRGKVDFVSGLSFVAWLTKKRPDALLITSWHSVAWCAFAARVARVRRVVLRQGIVRTFPRRSPRAMALHGITAIIANSEQIRDVWLASAPDFPRDKVRVVLNGIRPGDLDRADARARLRSELRVSGTTLLIGGAGHLFKRKGFDFLLRAFALSRISDAIVVIAGDGDERESLTELADALGIGERVRFLGHRTDTPDVIAGLDVFVLSSHNEGMANVMLEAMAGGTPVIASDISGVRTALGDTSDRPRAGWIVPPADDDALSHALADVSSIIRSSEPAVDHAVAEAKWRIDNWFGIDRMVLECEAIIFGR